MTNTSYPIPTDLPACARILPTGDVTEAAMRPGLPSCFYAIDNGSTTVGLLVTGRGAAMTAKTILNRMSKKGVKFTATRQWMGQDGTVYPKRSL